MACIALIEDAPGAVIATVDASAFPWGYALQQLQLALLGGALGFGACRLVPARLGSTLRALIELLVVPLLLAGFGMTASLLGWQALLVSPTWAWAVGVAFAFYWLAVWWPLRVVVRRKLLAGGFPRTAALCLALALPLVTLWATFIEPQLLEVEHRNIAAGQLVEPLRVAHLSDLQLIARSAREDDLVDAVAAFDPHLIILTGDYIAASPQPDLAMAAAREVLARLHARHGFVALPSDSDTREQRAEIFAGLEIRYLENERVDIEIGDTRVRVVGLAHLTTPDVSLVERGDADLLLVAAHQPDVATLVADHGVEVDLFLAGHTHGGQLQVPGIGPLVTFCERTPRHVAAGGLFDFDGMTVSVSRGLGMEGSGAPRFRLLCRPHAYLLLLGDDEPSPLGAWR